MAYTVIEVKVQDQRLIFTSDPYLASGGIEQLQFRFTFGSLWDGATKKTAVFYRYKKEHEVYHRDLEADGSVLAPMQPFATKGAVYMGVFAEYEDGTTRTSEVVLLDVNQGAITKATAADNAPNIYAALENRVAALEKTRLPDVTQADNGKQMQVVNGQWTAVADPDVILEEQTVAGFVDGGTWWGYGSADAIGLHLVAGKTYRVIWDGKEYICAAVGYDGGSVYVGDPGIAMDEGTGEYPFQIRTDANPSSGSNRFACLTTDEGESHDIGIYRIAEPELPKVTAADNGKSLKVVGGAWVAASENSILENHSISGFSENSGKYTATLAMVLTLSAGKEYRVVWDGAEYLCKCYSEVSGGGTTITGLFLGNASIFVSSFPDTGETFFISVGADSTVVITTDSGENHVLSLYRKEPTYVQTVNGTAPDENGNVQVEIPESGGVSSWNDLTDKPFYEESGTTVLFEEQALTLTVQSNIGDLEIAPAPFTLVEGETYRVVFDGVEHELVCVSADGTLMIACTELDESTGDYTDGSFAIMYGSPELTGLDGGAVIVQVIGSVGSHTLAIYHNGTVIKPIDNKYLEPFHEEGGITDVVAEQTLTFTDQGGVYGNAELTTPLIADETYHVVWDGTEYSCTAYYDGTIGGVIMGNQAVISADLEDTGEPFIIAYQDGTLALGTSDTAETHTVRIYQGGEVVWKLNEECLPMDVIDARIEEYISAALEGDY